MNSRFGSEAGQPKKALLVPTVAVTVFLVIEGLIPAPLLDWVIKGLSTVIAGVT